MVSGVGAPGASDLERPRLVERLKRRGRLFDDRRVPIRSGNLLVLISIYLAVLAPLLVIAWDSVVHHGDLWFEVAVFMAVLLPPFLGPAIGFFTIPRRLQLGALIGAATKRSLQLNGVLFGLLMLPMTMPPDAIVWTVVIRLAWFVITLPIMVTMIGLGSKLRTWESRRDARATSLEWPEHRSPWAGQVGRKPR